MDPDMDPRSLPSDHPNAHRLAQEAESRGICERLDAAERNDRAARAAWLIARNEINRARVGSYWSSPRRRK
jgi:hypothetical protein